MKEKRPARLVIGMFGRRRIVLARGARGVRQRGGEDVYGSTVLPAQTETIDLAEGFLGVVSTYLGTQTWTFQRTSSFPDAEFFLDCPSSAPPVVSMRTITCSSTTYVERQDLTDYTLVKTYTRVIADAGDAGDGG